MASFFLLTEVPHPLNGFVTRRASTVIGLFVTSFSQSVYCSLDLDQSRETLQSRSFASAVLCRIAHFRSATLQLLTQETASLHHPPGVSYKRFPENDPKLTTVSAIPV
jgi:hypothetical protein